MIRKKNIFVVLHSAQCGKLEIFLSLRFYVKVMLAEKFNKYQHSVVKIFESLKKYLVQNQKFREIKDSLKFWPYFEKTENLKYF